MKRSLAVGAALTTLFVLVLGWSNDWGCPSSRSAVRARQLQAENAWLRQRVSDLVAHEQARKAAPP